MFKNVSEANMKSGEFVHRQWLQTNSQPSHCCHHLCQSSLLAFWSRGGYMLSFSSPSPKQSGSFRNLSKNFYWLRLHGINKCIFDLTHKGFPPLNVSKILNQTWEIHDVHTVSFLINLTRWHDFMLYSSQLVFLSQLECQLEEISNILLWDIGL